MHSASSCSLSQYMLTVSQHKYRSSSCSLSQHKQLLPRSVATHWGTAAGLQHSHWGWLLDLEHSHWGRPLDFLFLILVRTCFYSFSPTAGHYHQSEIRDQTTPAYVFNLKFACSISFLTPACLCMLLLHMYSNSKRSDNAKVVMVKTNSRSQWLCAEDQQLAPVAVLKTSGWPQWL